MGEGPVVLGGEDEVEGEDCCDRECDARVGLRID